MTLNKLINEIIYNLKPVYRELGFDRNEIDIELIDMDDNDDTLAWCNTELECNRICTYDEISMYKKEHNSSIKFDISYEKTIYISAKVLFKLIDTMIDGLKITNEDIYDNVLISVLEATIIHELRHLYQFKTLQNIPLMYVSLINNPSKNTWGAIFNPEINYLFEKDAIHYSDYQKDLTILKDIKIKNYLNRIICNADLLELLDGDIYDSTMDNISHTIDLLRNYLVKTNRDNVRQPHIKEKEDDLFSKIKKVISICTEDNSGANMLYGALKKFGIFR
jgi:hypothetical protein